MSGPKVRTVELSVFLPTYGSWLNNHARAVALEKIIQDNPALGADELGRISRVQEQLCEVIAQRTGQHDPANPRPAAVIGARWAERSPNKGSDLEPSPPLWAQKVGDLAVLVIQDECEILREIVRQR